MTLLAKKGSWLGGCQCRAWEGATSRRLCACSHRCCWGCKTKKMVLKLLRHARQARSQPQFWQRPYIRGGCRRRRGLSSLDSWPAIFVVAWDAARRSSAVGAFWRPVASQCAAHGAPWWCRATATETCVGARPKATSSAAASTCSLFEPSSN